MRAWSSCSVRSSKPRKRELDLQIDSILLESEAKKRGVTPSQVIKDEVIAKVQAPTEAEAQAFYEQNKANSNGIQG